MDNSNRLFRKAVFGGFNRDDVIDYIEGMKNEFFEYRKQVEETISGLNKKISELEGTEAEHTSDSEASPFEMAARRGLFTDEDEVKNNVNFSLDEINAATDHLKQTADRLCESLTDFMERISTSCISVTVENLPEQKLQEKQDSFADSALAMAYETAIKRSGDAIIENAFKEENDADAATEEKSSSFTDILDSVINESTPSEASDDVKGDDDSDPSILDGILSSSSFLS